MEKESYYTFGYFIVDFLETSSVGDTVELLVGFIFFLVGYCNELIRRLESGRKSTFCVEDF